MASITSIGLSQSASATTPAASTVTGIWQGSYFGCGQGPTALTLNIGAHGGGDQLKAKLKFHALPNNPGVPRVPTGTYAMSGYFTSTTAYLVGFRWIKQPGGYAMVNFAGALPKSKKFSGVVSTCTTLALTKSASQ